MSVPAIGLIDTVLTGGMVGTKCGLFGLPFSLFTALVILVFIEILGDRPRDITSSTIGDLCTLSCSGASVDSSDSSSPSDIG